MPENGLKLDKSHAISQRHDRKGVPEDMGAEADQVRVSFCDLACVDSHPVRCDGPTEVVRREQPGRWLSLGQVGIQRGHRRAVQRDAPCFPSAKKDGLIRLKILYLQPADFADS